MWFNTITCIVRSTWTTFSRPPKTISDFFLNFTCAKHEWIPVSRLKIEFSVFIVKMSILFILVLQKYRFYSFSRSMNNLKWQIIYNFKLNLRDTFITHGFVKEKTQMMNEIQTRKRFTMNLFIQVSSTMWLQEVGSVLKAYRYNRHKRPQKN